MFSPFEVIARAAGWCGATIALTTFRSGIPMQEGARIWCWLAGKMALRLPFFTKSLAAIAAS